jgi:hypothetical protein
MTRTQQDTPASHPTMLLVGWAASVVPVGGIEGIETCVGDTDVALVAAPVPTTAHA